MKYWLKCLYCLKAGFVNVFLCIYIICGRNICPIISFGPRATIRCPTCLSTYVFDTSAHPVCADMIHHQFLPLCYCRPSENSRRYYCIMGPLNAWFWLAASDWTRCAIIFRETHGECSSRHTFTRFLSLPIFLITKLLTALVCYQQLKLPLLGLKWYGISNRAIGWDAEEINLDVLRCGNHSISRIIDSRSFHYI